MFDSNRPYLIIVILGSDNFLNNMFKILHCILIFFEFLFSCVMKLSATIMSHFKFSKTDPNINYFI